MSKGLFSHVQISQILVKAKRSGRALAVLVSALLAFTVIGPLPSAQAALGSTRINLKVLIRDDVDSAAISAL